MKRDREVTKLKLLAVFFAASCAGSGAATAAPPILYAQPAYESPVRGEPDDLLLLTGDGLRFDDTVVYQVVNDVKSPVTPPAIPRSSDSSLGIATTVSTANAPYSLTVRLPNEIDPYASYVLWVHTKEGEWSRPIKINDARPLWVTPAYTYATKTVASLPRYLKVVGRNLLPAEGFTTKVRLTGPDVVILQAREQNKANSVDRYVAQVALPAVLRPGVYSIELSRDGVGWIPVTGQRFLVRPDPIERPIFSLDKFGCRPNDEVDDTACIVAAIKAANDAGGGTVKLNAGVWRMSDGSVDGVTLDGVVVPTGVDISGAGKEKTMLVRGANWRCRDEQRRNRSCPSLTLQGQNTVQEIHFTDSRIYVPKDVNASAPFVQLGKRYERVAGSSGTEPTVSDVVIAENEFDRPYIGIGSGALPVERLFVVDNEFGAYKDAINLSGNRFNVGYKFRVDDSIISHNTFKPGSYLDVAIGQGAVASHIGASRRLDFSDNTADGASVEYLYDAATDAHGWRAGFFWHMNNNQEMLLVSKNTITCSGDKSGDGEAIAFDNNANTFAFTEVRRVVNATDNSVTVSGPLVAFQNGQVVPADFYVGHWMQIADGRGLGQLRRIDSYSTDASTGRVTFLVSPKWDVVPAPLSSRVTVGRQFWQVYALDNEIDHRSQVGGIARCLHSNRRPAATNPFGAGTIAVWAQMADSVVEGNRQYDTTGIRLSAVYRTDKQSNCTECDFGTSFLSFVEVRDNVIDQEYDWNSDCSWSGINLFFGASTDPRWPPPVASYGLSIARNTIVQADGLRGGGISLALSWLGGPPPHKWELVDNTLIYHNDLRDLAGSTNREVCDRQQSSRIGVNLNHAMIWRTILYANACQNVRLPLLDSGSRTLKVCSGSSLDSCECSRLNAK